MKQEEILFKEKRWKKGFTGMSKLLNLEKNLIRSRKHLDFGCGIGAFAFILSKKFPKLKITGIDIDKRLVKIANSRYKTRNLNFKSSNKLKDGYDSITCMYVVHEIKNLNKKLREIYRHLNKNGKIIVYDFRKVNKSKFRKLFDKEKKFHKKSKIIVKKDFNLEYREHNKWSLDQFRDIMENAGFITRKIKASGNYFLVYIGEK